MRTLFLCQARSWWWRRVRELSALDFFSLLANRPKCARVLAKWESPATKPESTMAVTGKLAESFIIHAHFKVAGYIGMTFSICSRKHSFFFYLLRFMTSALSKRIAFMSVFIFGVKFS